MKTYRGMIKASEAGVVLDAGGIEVKIEGDREKFAPLDGLFTTIIGEQSGDTIRNAAPALQPEAAAAASSGTARFEQVIAEIKSKGESFLALPWVLGLRPGFRTENGDQTEDPAVIIVARPGQEI